MNSEPTLDLAAIPRWAVIVQPKGEGWQAYFADYPDLSKGTGTSPSAAIKSLLQAYLSIRRK